MPSPAEEEYSIGQLILLKQEADFFEKNPSFQQDLQTKCGVKILTAYHEYGKVNRNPHIHSFVETRFKPKQTKKLILQTFPELKGKYKIPFIKNLAVNDICKLYLYIVKDGNAVYEPEFSIVDYDFNGVIRIDAEMLEAVKTETVATPSKSLTFSGQVHVLEKPSWTKKVVDDVLDWLSGLENGMDSFHYGKKDILQRILTHYSNDYKVFDEFIIKRVYNLIMLKKNEDDFINFLADKI